MTFGNLKFILVQKGNEFKLLSYNPIVIKGSALHDSLVKSGYNFVSEFDEIKYFKG